jgi:hypothetical protein
MIQRCLHCAVKQEAPLVGTPRLALGILWRQRVASSLQRRSTFAGEAVLGGRRLHSSSSRVASSRGGSERRSAQLARRRCGVGDAAVVHVALEVAGSPAPPRKSA